jgi:hypothetical protein
VTDATTPLLDALQAAAAGEHAAVWASGRAAGELGGRGRGEALVELDAHRVARDELRAVIVALGAEPVEAAPAYLEPFPVDSPRTARALMAQVNSALAATYADLAAASEPAARREAARSSVAAAVRAIEWGGDPQAFPGA